MIHAVVAAVIAAVVSTSASKVAGKIDPIVERMDGDSMASRFDWVADATALAPALYIASVALVDEVLTEPSVTWKMFVLAVLTLLTGRFALAVNDKSAAAINNYPGDATRRVLGTRLDRFVFRPNQDLPVPPGAIWACLVAVVVGAYATTS